MLIYYPPGNYTKRKKNKSQRLPTGQRKVNSQFKKRSKQDIQQKFLPIREVDKLIEVKICDVFFLVSVPSNKSGISSEYTERPQWKM